MYNHAPKNYICPICLAVQGVESEKTLIRKSDLVYSNDFVSGFIASFFIGKSLGHVIIVPNKHFENIYDLPNAYGSKISEAAQEIALALKRTYLCEGITTVQNNEPDGNQHAFHYHLHLFPRYKGDELHKHMLEKQNTTPEERKSYAEKLQEYFAKKQ